MPGLFDIVQSDFLVIGAGAIGLATALELADRGASVTVLERSRAGGESSWAGGGILSPLPPWSYGPEVNQLSEYSRRLFPDWCGRLHGLSGVDPEYLETGMLVLPPFDQALAADWCARHGWRLEMRSGHEFGLARCDEEALWLPDVAQARNPRLVESLRGAALARGVKLVESCDVTRVDAGGVGVAKVVTSRGDYSAGTYVIAAGAWTGDLPGLDVPGQRIFPVRGQMLLFRLAPGSLGTVALREGRYLIPRKDGHVLAGSTTEPVGFDRSTTETARQALLEFAGALLPALNESALLRHWSGLRPGSPDNLPLICRHSIHENLFINAGHFRYGLTMAPGSAKLLADLVEGKAPAISARPYALATEPARLPRRWSNG
jgi:glycine oxidase